MWVQKLGGCPSFGDFYDFGKNLDSTKFSEERYVCARLQSLPETTNDENKKLICIGETSKESQISNGRNVIFDQKLGCATFTNFVNGK